MAFPNDNFRQIIRYYNAVVKGVEAEALESARAFGGVIRATKGALVENIAMQLVKIAWRQLERDEADISFQNKRYKVPIRQSYIRKIADPEIRQHLESHKDSLYYGIKQDVSVCIRGDFVLSIECKAYAENSMMKRILVDAMLLRTQVPNLHFALIQLESQLGGDYSNLARKPMGSASTHTLMSYFPEIKLEVITLLEGERHPKRPIHDKKFFKPLMRESLKRAANTLADLLSRISS